MWRNTSSARTGEAVGSSHALIMRAGVLLAVYVLLGALARAARDIIIAYRFGVSVEVDAYLFVFNLVNWPISVWLSVVTVVLVPLIAGTAYEQGQHPRFDREVLGLTLVAGACVGIAAWLGLPLLFSASWTGLPVATAALGKEMSAGLAWMAPLGFVGSYFSVTILAQGRHTNTLLEGVPALVLVGALLMFSDNGTSVLIWGTVLGLGVQLVLLALAAPGGMAALLPSTRFASPLWRRFFHGLAIVIAGQLVMSFVTIVDQFFAARLDEGSITILNYSNRVLALLLGLGATVITRATLPVFARVSEGDPSGEKLALQWSNALFLAGLAIIFVGWLVAPSLIKLIFERGSFTSQNSFDVANVLRLSLIQIPFYFSALVIVSYLSSRKLYKWIFWSGVNGLIFKLGANLLLVSDYGLSGLVLASSVMYAANFCFFRFAVSRISDPLEVGS